jgi:hypothetical protein
MEFVVTSSSNLDIINLLNVLTGDELYTSRHAEAYDHFAPRLSAESRKRIDQAVELNGGPMLSPLVTLYISAVPGFERLPLVALMQDGARLSKHFAQTPYYDADELENQISIVAVLAPVVDELLALGFRQYWEQKHARRALWKRRDAIREFATRYQLSESVATLLGSDPVERLTLYLCAFIAPHGVKLVGPRYMNDVRYDNDIMLGTAIHELFHPPYSYECIKPHIDRLAEDPLIQHAFSMLDPRYGYNSMSGFIEEMVVEAMGIHTCWKLGLEPEPLKYFAEHDGGTHKLSPILFEAFERAPKDASVPFEAYFLTLLDRLPVGRLDAEYARIMDGISA